MVQADVLDGPEEAVRMLRDRVAGLSEPGAHKLAAHLAGAESRGFAADWVTPMTSGVGGEDICMSKRVRYAAGAIGLAPAIGLAMQPAAAAPSAHDHAMTKPRAGKSVSLLRACTGTIQATSSGNSPVDKIQFFYTPFSPASTCIGTVKTHFFISAETSELRVRVWEHSQGGGKHLGFSQSTGSLGHGYHSVTWGIHRTFGFSPIQVCVAKAFPPNSAVCKGVA
jgi:hypothetical protein